MTITPATLAQTIRAAGINPVELADEWDVTPRVAEQWQTSKQPPFKAEDYAAKHLEQMAGHVNQLLDVIQAAGDSTVLLRSYDPDTPVNHPTATAQWTGRQHNRAIHHLLLMEARGDFEAHIDVVPDAAWIFDNSTHLHILSPNTQPSVILEDYDAETRERISDHIQQLLDVIQAAGDSTVLLRSYWPDDLVTGSSGTPLHGHQYNLTIQHLLLLEELGAFEATIVVVPTNRWFDNDTRHLVLSPRTPVFAVAHRLPDQARIDLCVPATDSDDPGVESAEDLIAVDTLHVDLPLPQEQVSASGLWKQGVYKPILLAEGFRPTTDWRLSGTGYPIAIASVLPIDVTPHLHSRP